jgi:hypothetical protein
MGWYGDKIIYIVSNTYKSWKLRYQTQLKLTLLAYRSKLLTPGTYVIWIHRLQRKHMLFVLASARTGRPDPRTYNLFLAPFRAPMRDPHCPERH